MTRPNSREQRIKNLTARVERTKDKHPVKVVPLITRLYLLMHEQLRAENRLDRQ